MISMKVHQFARGLWAAEPHEPPSLTLGCKRLRPSLTTSSSTPFDLTSFIRPESGPRKPDKDSSLQVESHPGGTRWNPTEEQIGILETLYRGGMRTPNAQQIEQITARLGKYGKIEGKNVFYWFQNHKARERQKQKRTSLGHTREDKERDREDSTSPYKRKCRSWGFECVVEDCYNGSNRLYNCRDDRDRDQLMGDRTLELFPLHPERR